MTTATPTESNSDAGELAKFSTLAQTWWDPQGELRTLHHINPMRLAWIERVCGGLSAKRVLDVGCGGGLLAQAMAQRGAAFVLGIDLAEAALQVAQQQATQHGCTNLRYQNISAESLAEQIAPAAQPDVEPALQSFDIVTCMEMLEHVPDPAQIVQACARLVKPQGWVLFATLDRSARSFATAIVAAEYLLNLVPRGTHEYKKLIRPGELAAYCRAAGLSPRELCGLHYNPLTQRAWTAPTLQANYLLAAQRSA